MQRYEIGPPTGAEQDYSISSEVVPGTAGARVTIAGEIDCFGIQTLLPVLRRLSRQTAGELVLDLGGIRFLDSSALTGLADLVAGRRASGRPTWITRPTAVVRRLTRLCGLPELLGPDLPGQRSAAE